MLNARAPGAAVVSLKELPAGVAIRVGGTRGLGAAGFNPGRRPVHACNVGAVGKMPDARRFWAVVGSQGARELVAVSRCAVSQSLGRLPVPRINVRGLGSMVEAGRRWALDERGTRPSGEICSCSPGNAGGGRARGAVPPSGRQSQCGKCRVDGH